MQTVWPICGTELQGPTFQALAASAGLQDQVDRIPLVQYFWNRT